MLNTLKVLNTHVIWTLKRLFSVKSIPVQNIQYLYSMFQNALLNRKIVFMHASLTYGQEHSIPIKAAIFLKEHT